MMRLNQLLSIAGLCLAIPLAAHAAAPTVTYIYTDPQGTPLAETDAEGNVTATFDYRPYGAQALGTPPQGPGYTGHVNDADTGLVYMQARYYDPLVGRFLTVDPVGPTAGNEFDFNRYAYVYNNPINNVDPDGRCPVCAVAAVAGTMAAGAGVGAGTNYLVQKAFNPGKPVNMNEVKMAAALGSVSGGTGMLAIAAVRAGISSTATAVTINVAANGVAGAGGRAIQGKLDGQPATSGQIISSGIGSAVGTLTANGIGYLAGDFSQAVTQGAAAKMMGAAIDSPAGIGAHITSTTAAVGIGTEQSLGQAAFSQAGQAVAQGAISIEQKKIEEGN
jgi:RHS repeat-associated protein